MEGHLLHPIIPWKDTKASRLRCYLALSPQCATVGGTRWGRHHRWQLHHSREQPVERNRGRELIAASALADALNALRRDDVLIVAKRDRIAREAFLSRLIEREVAKKGARIVSAAGRRHRERRSERRLYPSHPRCRRRTRARTDRGAPPRSTPREAGKGRARRLRTVRISCQRRPAHLRATCTRSHQATVAVAHAPAVGSLA